MAICFDKFTRLRYIYILSIVNCFIMTCIFKVDISFDTHTYINAWSSLQDGYVDKWRTPVYPLVLGLMKAICGDYYLYSVVIIQHFVFLVSIRFLFLLMLNVNICKNISFFLTFIYALYPCVATYNCCIVTEAFAVAGTIFLLYSINKLYEKGTARFGFYAFLCLLFLIFLRPAVVYLLPVTMVGWCVIAIKRRSFLDKTFIWGAVGNGIVTICLIIYMVMFKFNFGVFTPSGIGLINQYTIAKAANIIDFNDKKEELGFYQEAEYYINTIGMKSFSDSLNNSISRNKIKYINRISLNVRKASEDNLLEPSWPTGIIGVVSNICCVKIKYVLFLLLVYAVVLLRWMKKQKELVFFSCLLFLIGISNFVLIIIGSPGEYGRLSLPALPAYFIMFGQLLNVVKLKNVMKVRFE